MAKKQLKIYPLFLLMLLLISEFSALSSWTALAQVQTAVPEQTTAVPEQTQTQTAQPEAAVLSPSTLPESRVVDPALLSPSPADQPVNAAQVTAAPESAAPESAVPERTAPESTETVSPLVQGTAEPYHARWARQSVHVLEENGIALPSNINYAELINRADYLNVLAKIADTSRSQLVLPYEQSLIGEITRAEAIHRVILAFGLEQALKAPVTQESRFRDILPQHPAFAAVVLAENLKLINGYPDRTIRPDERLSWGEALILIETLYSWRKALPTDAPQWVRNYQKRQNMWYQLVDGFRLLLTLAYVGIALFFFIKSYRRSRHQQASPFKSLSFLLGIVTLLLALMWVNDILFNYRLIPREIYAIGGLISIFVALLMLKTGSHIDEKMSEPKPQAVIDSGYVESVNHEKGEIFIKDIQTQAHALAVVSPDTKIASHLEGKSVAAFFSEIRAGDIVSLKGASSFNGSVIEAERLSIVQREVVQAQQQQINWQTQTSQNQQTQQIQNRITPRPPSAPQA